MRRVDPIASVKTIDPKVSVEARSPLRQGPSAEASSSHGFGLSRSPVRTAHRFNHYDYRCNKANQKIELYQSAVPGVDEQIRIRLQQMVANRIDALVLAAAEQHIIQQVDQAVTRYLEGLLNPSGGNQSGYPLGQNALGSMQQLIGAEFDTNNWV